MPRYGLIPAIPPQELFSAAFRNIYTDRGTRYSCSQRDIDWAQNFRLAHTRQYVSANRADDEIAAHNRLDKVPGRSEEAAISRLLDALRMCERHRWGPDFVIKAFLDLDKIFFCSRLRGIVRVVWKHGFHNEPRTAGVCKRDPRRPNSGLLEIWLNADKLLRHCSTPFSEMWATILHEMCHAYEMTQVRSHQWEPNAHGPHFGAKLRAVDRRMMHLFGLRAKHANEHYQAYQC